MCLDRKVIKRRQESLIPSNFQHGIGWFGWLPAGLAGWLTGARLSRCSSSSNFPFLEKGRNVAGMAFELAKSSLKEIQIYSGDLLMHEFLLLTWLLLKQ